MTLTTIAKISAAYLGLAVSIATASNLWEFGRDTVQENGLLSGYEVASTNQPG